MDTILTTEQNLHPSMKGARRWTQILDRYGEPSHTRSIAELAVTALPLTALWLGAGSHSLRGIRGLRCLLLCPLPVFSRACSSSSTTAVMALSFRIGGRTRVGHVIGVLTLTPYDLWRRTHAIHHANVGNLGRRGIGDINTLTVREYCARSRWGRWRIGFTAIRW